MSKLEADIMLLEFKSTNRLSNKGFDQLLGIIRKNAPRKKRVARKDILGQANDLPNRPRGWKNPRVFQWLYIVPWRKIQRLEQVPQVWSSMVQGRAIRWGYQDQRRSRKGRLAYSSNHLEEEKFDVEWKCLFQLYQKCSLDVQMLTLWTM